MTTIFYPLRPDTLPDATRHVEIAGRTLPVSITQEDHGYLATHMDTGCWGYGDTADAALADIALMLEKDRAFYLEGPCAGMEMPGVLMKRRAALRRTFGEGD
jgi:hypothetical protein